MCVFVSQLAPVGVIFLCWVYCTKYNLDKLTKRELLFPFATHGHFYSTRHARRRHTRQFGETSGKTNAYNRSLFAMVRIYNILPQDYVDATSVSDFQSLLTSEVRKRCGGGVVGWKICFRTDHSTFNVVSETHFKSMKTILHTP